MYVVTFQYSKLVIYFYNYVTMMYVGIAIKAIIICIGLYMMFNFPDMTKPPFISGMAITLTGLYLALQKYFS